MRWWIKALAQKVLSALPRHQRLNFAWQRSRWGSLHLSDFFLEDRLAHAQRHLHAWQHATSPELPARVLELGTGWYPVVPLALRMAGVPTVWTVDARPHLRPPLIRELAEMLLTWERNGKLAQLLSLKESPKQWLTELLAGPLNQSHLAQMGIHYLVCKLEDLPSEVGPFPMMVSNNTLEHIPADLLPGMFRNMQRILPDDGLMSHYTDHADHFSYTDARISPYHFLRFSPAQWKGINSRLSFQNRLRVNQLEEIFTKEGWEVLDRELEYGDQALANEAPLHAPFSQFSWETWGVTYSHLILRKKNGEATLPFLTLFRPE
ncbi:MAG: class I SAM-dependent methyltransferase [Bacteroidota bacterium]